MESVHGMSSEQSELLGVVRGVRNRYRTKIALRGAAITLATAFALFALSAYAMHALKYSDAVVITARVLTLLIVAAVAVWFIVLPLRPKLHDLAEVHDGDTARHVLDDSQIVADEQQGEA